MLCKMGISCILDSMSKDKSYYPLYRAYKKGGQIVLNKDDLIAVKNGKELYLAGTFKTFKENAFLKAEAISKLTDKVVVADDSGLEIRALDNFPGIYSARFMEGHPYSEKFVAINKMLDGKLDRYARFNSTLCVMNLKPEPLYFVGYAEGEVLKKPQGESSFGYDPIFYSYKAKKTFAELSQNEKNAVSHRGEAIKALVKYLEENNYIHEKL